MTREAHRSQAGRREGLQAKETREHRQGFWRQRLSATGTRGGGGGWRETRAPPLRQGGPEGLLGRSTTRSVLCWFAEDANQRRKLPNPTHGCLSLGGPEALELGQPREPQARLEGAQGGRDPGVVIPPRSDSWIGSHGQGHQSGPCLFQHRL